MARGDPAKVDRVPGAKNVVDRRVPARSIDARFAEQKRELEAAVVSKPAVRGFDELPGESSAPVLGVDADLREAADGEAGPLGAHRPQSPGGVCDDSSVVLDPPSLVGGLPSVTPSGEELATRSAETPREEGAYLLVLGR